MYSEGTFIPLHVLVHAAAHECMHSLLLILFKQGTDHLNMSTLCMLLIDKVTLASYILL